MSLLPEIYEQKVYAGWLGKCIGVRFGAPLENWTYRQIRDHLGEVAGYLPTPEGKVFQPDDDTNVPAILLYGIQDDPGPLTAERLGKVLLNALGDQHGSLWWGGYGISTEHTAYLNLKSGLPAPLTGSSALNGKTVAEQIGGQIFSDLWGWLAPGDPPRAAAYAREASSVTHDGEGVYGGMFIAGLVSAAFAEKDPRRLVQAGLDLIPAHSEYARVVNAVLDFYRRQPDDWRACYAFIEQHFGYDRYPGIVHVIPNAALVAMGLLYGKGDFSQAIRITNMGGWDTDCNVGNVGAIMGTAVGLEGIEPGWRDPVNDVIAAASILGTRSLLDLPTLAGATVRLGCALAGEQPAPPRARCHFELPGSTHGFQTWGEQRNILLLRQEQHQGKGALKVVVRLLKKKQDMRLYLETYYPKQRLASDYYASGFSPTIYPGQTLRARLYLPPGSPASILAALYVWDGAAERAEQGRAVQLVPGQWQDLEWRIPPLENACLSQAGITFRNLDAAVWKGEFFLDEFDWGGAPELTLDLAKAKPEYGAIRGWTYLRGAWRPESDGYHGSGAEVSETYTGDVAWGDLSLRVRLAPLLGETHLIQVRVQGALRGYAAGLAPGGRLALYKKEDGVYREVCSTPFAWQAGQPVELELRAAGTKITLQAEGGPAEGGPALEWEDTLDPYQNGQIGLANFPGCHTRYEALHVS